MSGLDSWTADICFCCRVFLLAQITEKRRCLHLLSICSEMSVMWVLLFPSRVTFPNPDSAAQEWKTNPAFTRPAWGGSWNQDFLKAWDVFCSQPHTPELSPVQPSLQVTPGNQQCEDSPRNAPRSGIFCCISLHGDAGQMYHVPGHGHDRLCSLKLLQEEREIKISFWNHN